MIASWPLVPMGDFLTPVREPISIQDDVQYQQITVSLHGRGVRLRQVVWGTAIETKSQYLARAGRFIYSRIDARNGAMGIIPDDLDGAVVTGDFPTFAFDLDTVEPRFIEYMTKTASFEEACRAPSRGITNRKRLKESEFLAIRIALPPLPEQRRIAAKIDEIAARADEARQLVQQIEVEQTALLLRRVEELSRSAVGVCFVAIVPEGMKPCVVKAIRE